MGWTDIFKSKTSASDLDGRVHWFGKLPTYPDYYTSPGDDEWSLEFNDWILKGFEMYRSRSAQTSTGRSLLPLGACLVRLPESGMTVLAAILDYGGDMRGRPFPMCFYVGIPSAALPGPTSVGCTGIVETIERLLGLRRDVSRFVNSPGKFEHTFGDREIDLSWLGEDDGDDAWTKHAREIGFGAWFEAVREGVKTKEPGGWVGQVGLRGEGISSLASASFEATLRFPIATRWPLSVQVSGWLAWLGSKISLKKRVYSMFFSSCWEGDMGWLTLVIRPVIEEDFVLMTPAGKALAYVDDVDASGDGGTGDSGADLPDRWIDLVTGTYNSA